MITTIEGRFIRYGAVALNRADIAEVDFPNGVVLMRSGAKYKIPEQVLLACFSDTIDLAKVKFPSRKEEVANDGL